MTTHLPRPDPHSGTALVVVDVQRRFDDAEWWGPRNNPDCETTARVGADPGHQVLFPPDATHTFDRTGPDGTVVNAETLPWVTGVNLHREFATVLTSADLFPRTDRP